MIKSLENKTHEKLRVELGVYFRDKEEVTCSRCEESPPLRGLVGGKEYLKPVFIFTWK